MLTDAGTRRQTRHDRAHADHLFYHKTVEGVSLTVLEFNTEPTLPGLRASAGETIIGGKSRAMVLLADRNSPMDALRYIPPPGGLFPVGEVWSGAAACMRSRIAIPMDRTDVLTVAAVPERCPSWSWIGMVVAAGRGRSV